MSKKATKRELLRRKRAVERTLFLKKASKKSYERPEEFKVATDSEKGSEE